MGKVCWICGQIVRELLLFCTSRTSAAHSCTADDLLREGRGPGACRRTTSADSLQANTLVRLFAPQGQTLFAPRFRSTQPWSYAHNPAMPGPCRHLVRQFQFIHPPAALGGDEADGAQRGCIRHNRVIPCPAREVLALTSQHDLIKCKAAVRL